MSADQKARNPVVWVAVSLTLVWVLITTYLVVSRWEDYWPLFGSTKEERMPLNELGDMLGGLFAPLAFLWLFTATWLQRQELELQRNELADTREVLADQMREMERTANENKEQTVIMSRTLQATTERSVYDSFNLELYYLARRLRHILKGHHFHCKDKEYTLVVPLLDLPKEHEVSLEYADTIDFVFEKLNRRSEVFSLRAITAIPGSEKNRSEGIHALEVIEYSAKLLEALVGTYGKSNNPLVSARMSHLEIVGTINNLRQTEMYLNRALR